MASKPVKIRDLNPLGRKPYGVYSRYEEFFNLLMNAVKIERNDGEVIAYPVETFIKRQLLEGGCVGYDRMVDKWYMVAGVGVNELGNPTDLRLITMNGTTYKRKAYYEPAADGAYKIDALPVPISLSEMIRETTEFMTACDVAIRQNVEACKTPFIVVCKNDNLRLSYAQAIQQKQQGQAVVLVNEDLGEGLKAVNIGVDALFNDFAQIRDTERDNLLTKLGIMNANTDKKERVQSAEVNATIGQATDYIYLLIDTFNKQTKQYSLPFEMTLNGSLEEIYTDDNGKEDDSDVNDAEKEQPNNAR